MSTELEPEIAHVLLIDVVGYSKLLVNEQIELLEQLNQIVRQTECFRKAEANGKLMRLPTGDGMALLFLEGLEAPVRCALEIAATVREESRMQLRMGVHSGPIKAVRDVDNRPNFAGDGINLAQRVLDCGDAGHILVSQRVAADLAPYRHWNNCLHPLGECEVKHGVKVGIYNLCKDGAGNAAVPEKIRLQQRRTVRWRKGLRRWAGASRWRKLGLFGLTALAVCALLLLLWWFVSPQAKVRVAVMPFQNANEDKETSYYVNGIQQAICDNLSNVPGLDVISRTSVAGYETPGRRTPHEIARTFGVSHILEGEVQRLNGRVRLHVQLIDGRTGLQIWGKPYDRELEDVFAIQSEIGEEVARQLRIRLTPKAKAAIEERPTTDLLAWDLYLKGRSAIDTAVYSPQADEDLISAVHLLNEAVARDQRFFQAWYQLAHAHDQLYLRFDRTPETMRAAENAINRMQKLKPEAGETHLALAKHLYWVYRDFVRARAELEIAQEALPNDPTPPLILAFMDRRQGEWARSTRNYRLSLERDPTNADTLRQLALTYFQLRDFAEMRRLLQRAARLAPGNLTTKNQLASVELECCANPAPLRASINEILARNPSAGPAISDFWFDLALAENQGAEAVLVAKQMSEGGCQVEQVPFPRSWCQGVAARLNDDQEAARAFFEQTRVSAQQLVAAQPDHAGSHCVLAMASAALGLKDEAIAEGKRAVDLLPISKDATDGPLLVGYFAIVNAWVGEKDRAIEQLKEAVAVPSFWSYGHLKLHPYWEPLRSDPHFQEVLTRLAPKDAAPAK